MEKLEENIMIISLQILTEIHQTQQKYKDTAHKNRVVEQPNFSNKFHVKEEKKNTKKTTCWRKFERNWAIIRNV